MINPYRFAPPPAATVHNSLYEVHNNLSVKEELRMHENFQGGAVSPEWTLYNIAGTGATFVQSDGAGEGVTLQLDATANDAAVVEFNSLRSVDPDTVNVVGVIKTNDIANGDTYIGTTNEKTFGKNYMLAGVRQSTNTDKWAMITFDATGWTSLNSGSASNTNWNVHQMIRSSTNCVHKVNGTTSTTHTTDLTTVKQSPCIERGNGGAGSNNYTKCRWFEVYQT